MSETQDPAQLAEAIKGMSDDDLKANLKEQGYDTVLQQIFSGMEEAFSPEKAGNTSAVIQYDIETDDGTKSWTVNIADGTCKTSSGAADSPRVTLQMNIIDFVRLIFRQADGMQLFMSGKLKLKGDMMFAQQMQGYFEQRF
ncbi:MAG: SCP2 sterol-binding domain-containing protein [Actinobacteria bacterium]|nr:SCP2 sterol-binding domain-containing protein [Actinomycetota bacterium]